MSASMSTENKSVHLNNTLQKKPCRIWASQGQCHYGKNCKFSHGLPGQTISQNRMNAVHVSLEDHGFLSVPPRPSMHSNARSSIGSPSTTLRPVCWGWKKGTCLRGNQCKFAHKYEFGTLSSDETTEKVSNRSTNYSQSSRWQERNQHTQGSPEIHTEDAINKEIAESTRSEARPEDTLPSERGALETQVRCHHEVRNERAKQREKHGLQRDLRMGNERQMLARRAEEELKIEEERRAMEVTAKEAVTKRREQHEREAAAVEQLIVLDSTLITCSAGLSIKHVITGFELCKILIKNLPQTVKRREIEEIFTSQGLQNHDFSIRELKPIPNGNSLEATVLANEEYGQAIALGLDGMDFRGLTLKFTVSENALGSGMDLASRKRPFICVSWNVPSLTVVASYSTMEEAQERARTLNLTMWRGKQIKAVMNERPPGVAGLRNFVPSSIKVMGLPTDSMSMDLAGVLGTTNIKSLKSFIFDLKDSFSTIRGHLSTSSGIQMDTYEVVDNGDHGEAKIKVELSDWEDAKNAHSMIQALPKGPVSPHFRPWIPPKPVRYSIMIPQQQYDAQKRLWDELSATQIVDAYIKVERGLRGDIFIKVLGHSKKATGVLKVRVENIASGQKLDSSLWHSSLRSAEGRAFLNRIYIEKKVFIRHDFRSKSLRAYGPPQLVDEAHQMIKDEAERLADREITWTIDARSVGFFMREGLGKLQGLLGEENARINFERGLCRIKVKGGDEAKHHLQRLVEESKTGSVLQSLLPDITESVTCPICMDEVSNPEELGCGHTYCAGCLKHYLTSATDGKTFPIICIGNEATCNIPVAIPFIRRFVPVKIFQDLVDNAFNVYLEHHTQDFRHCTTPDCKQIYRHRTDSAVLQCPSCFSSICSGCDEEAHEGMTCTEWRVQNNPAEQERLNEELFTREGIKKCPQCRIPIQKSEGCNHMSCRCGAHICWVCMGVFNEGEIYHHMASAHGGYYENQLPAGVNNQNIGNEAFLAAQIDELARIEQQRVARAAPRPPAAQPAVVPLLLRGDAYVRENLALEQRREGEALRELNERRRIEAERRLRELREAAQRDAVRQQLTYMREREEARRRAEELRRREEENRRGFCVVM